MSETTWEPGVPYEDFLASLTDEQREGLASGEAVVSTPEGGNELMRQVLVIGYSEDRANILAEMIEAMPDLEVKQSICDLHALLESTKAIHDIFMFERMARMINRIMRCETDD